MVSGGWYNYSGFRVDGEGTTYKPDIIDVYLAYRNNLRCIILRQTHFTNAVEYLG